MKRSRQSKAAGTRRNRAAEDCLDVMIETPRGSRNKFKYDEQFARFRLDKVLPAGAVFPYDFGFVPGTRADDGDPIDVLLLMDAPAFVGCLVPARLVGVIEAEQVEENGDKTENDRLIALAQDAHDYADVKTIHDINPNLIKELGHFFVSYHAMRKSRFKVLGTRGPKYAWGLVEKATQNYQKP